MFAPMHALIPPLPADALFALLAPAGPPRPSAMDAVPGLLHELGVNARIYSSCRGPAQLHHLAASDAQRLADLHHALDDPDVHALLALRGGYGCIRLLAQLDRERVARAGKPLIGYSDLTSLHAVWAQLGIPAWHAPMPASDWVVTGGRADAEYLLAQLRRGLWPGDVQQVPQPHRLNQPGRAQGRLLGGNLSVLASCLGTPAMPDLAGCVLFLEDIGEDPYRIDRYLAQLKLAGALADVAGFVLGSFTDAENCDAVLADHLQPLARPLLAGWPAGHGQPNRALALGLPVTLDVAERQLRW
jgi:muramoyltetrapeptide carboxypeptidase